MGIANSMPCLNQIEEERQRKKVDSIGWAKDGIEDLGQYNGLDISLFSHMPLLERPLWVTFFFLFILLLKDSCFTEFCCFLSNLNMNQLQVYIYPLLVLPIFLPIPPLQVDTEPLFEFPESYSKFQLAIYFTYGNVSFHVTLFIHLTLSSPLPMSIVYSLCLFLHCCCVNKFFSTIFLDSVYVRQNMIFIFLFLTHFIPYNRFQVHSPHQD